MTLDRLKAIAVQMGYRIDVSEQNGIREERLIRPDGTVAVIARKAISQ